jgi:hypothetical protein
MGKKMLPNNRDDRATLITKTKWPSLLKSDIQKQFEEMGFDFFLAINLNLAKKSQ